MMESRSSNIPIRGFLPGWGGNVGNEFHWLTSLGVRKDWAKADAYKSVTI